MISTSIKSLCVLASLASAARLTVSIPPSQALPNPSTLPPSTHAVLLGLAGARHDAPIRRDNTFVFIDLADASYLLQLHTRDFTFPPLRVDVSHEAGTTVEEEQTIRAWQTFRGNEWDNKGPSYGSAKGELQVQLPVSGGKDYYQARGGFSLLSFLKSPMILMGLVSVAMIFGLPYLMDNMDPETKAEFEEMQKKSPMSGSTGAAAQIQNFDLAGWMAGKTSAPDSGSATSGGGSGSRKK